MIDKLRVDSRTGQLKLNILISRCVFLPQPWSHADPTRGEYNGRWRLRSLYHHKRSGFG